MLHILVELIIICSSVLVVSSQRSARYRGRELGVDYWSDEYRCDVVSFECCSNIRDFKTRGRDDLFRECRNIYRRDRDFVEDCKQGVEDVIENREDACRDILDGGSDRTARRFGYDLVMDYWRDEDFSCRNLECFIDEVRDKVYDECDSSFRDNDLVEACEEGAEDAIDEKVEECDNGPIDDDECEDIGENIAGGVVATVCPVSLPGGYRYFSPRLIVPRRCIRIAERECIDEATEEVKERIRDGDCGDLRRFRSRTKRVIEDLCKTEIQQYLD